MANRLGQLRRYNDQMVFGKYNILYLDINSLRKNLNELEFILKENPGIHFIVLSGVRMPAQHMAAFNINKYQCYFCNRSDGKGDVAIYVHENMISSEEKNHYNDSIHQVVVNIHSLKIRLGVIFAHPGADGDRVLEVYKKMLCENQRMILFADLASNNTMTENYSGTTRNQGFQFLNKISTFSATVGSNQKILDNVVTDISSFNYTVSISDVVFSDHKQILIGFDDKLKQRIAIRTGPKFYTQKEINPIKYSILLSQKDFQSIDQFNDLINILFDIKNESWEFVQKENYVDMQWYDQELIELIHKRNQYFSHQKDDPQSQDLLKEMENQIDKLRQQLQGQFNGHRINNAQKSPRKLQKVITQIFENKNYENVKIKAIRSEDDGKILTKVVQIAKCFNRYYRDAGKKLFKDIPDYAFEFFDTLYENEATLKFRLTNIDEVTEKIQAMKLTTHRNEIISSQLLKANSEWLAPNLVSSINKCLLTGKFPDELKTARIVPSFKKSEKDRLICSSYRPINVLQSLSKLLEMIIYDQIVSFCLEQNIFHRHQFGFLKKSGAAGAVATMLDFIQRNVYKNKEAFGACVFMDLQKAVETIPHDQLIDKLYKIGIRGTFLNLIKDFLKNRRQFVDIRGVFSHTLGCNPFGIPQGSNVGSLFLILYINDIFNLPIRGNFVLYSDDITMVYTETDPRKLEEDINNDLYLLNNWLVYNKLTINMKKIKYMIFSENKKHVNISLNLNVNDQKVECVRSQKYLGLIIQHNLKWNEQVYRIKRSIDCAGGSLYRFGNEIETSVLNQIYYSKIHKHLAVMSPIFGADMIKRDPATSQINRDLNILQRSQDKVIRRLFGRDSDGQQATDELYKEHGIMKVDQLIRCDSALLHRKMQMDIEKFGQNAYDFPSALDFESNDVGIRSACRDNYNSFHDSITEIDDYNQFKDILKKYLLEYGV